MLKRFWNYIKSLFGMGLDKLENPDILLEQAQREMTEMHARNRERAVQAITQKNNLQQMVDDLQKRVDNLQAKAELALKRGDRDLALQLLKEKQGYEISLNTTKESLVQAIETSEAVKVAIKREEEKIRQKTAEALALKAQWKNAQIQNAIHKALDGIGSIEDSTQAFGRAQEKIRNAQSEAGARAELARSRVESRLADLEMAEGNVAAENELAALEAKLGMGSAPVQPTTQTTTSAGDSDIERQLRELEAKVGGANAG
jgi:Phage shock protein A (IM30), suppresses sigma54-dependent transcription